MKSNNCFAHSYLNRDTASNDASCFVLVRLNMSDTRRMSQICAPLKHRFYTLFYVNQPENIFEPVVSKFYMHVSPRGCLRFVIVVFPDHTRYFRLICCFRGTMQ